MRQNINRWVNTALLLCAISLLLPSCFKNSKIKERSETDAGDTDSATEATTTGEEGTATDTHIDTGSNSTVDAGTETGIGTGTGSTEGTKTDTDIGTNTGSDSDSTAASKTDTESVTITATDTGSDSEVGSTTGTDTATETGNTAEQTDAGAETDTAMQTDTAVETDSAVQTDTAVETDTAVPTDTETEPDPNKRCGAERVDCTVTNQICNDEGICGPKPCESNADCPATGYECNLPWGHCTVSSCTGQADFTRCTLVTEESDRSYDICVNETCRSPGCGEASCNVPYPYFPLPDTGQTRCFDNETLLTPCPTSGDFYGQDAQYGWDTNPTGPRFTRDDSSDQPTVTDNITGLVWQGCTAGFTGSDCSGGLTVETAWTFEWEDAVRYCDRLVWGGYNDWRLPDRYALESILNIGRDTPILDTIAFPKTPNDYFWASSSYASDTSRAWNIFFRNGSLFDGDKGDHRDVRCVRGEGFGPLSSTGTTAPRFSRQNSGTVDWTVTDHATGLIWQGCPAGLTGEACDIDTGLEDTYTWQEALAYCEFLGFGGSGNWRLPNKRELLSIADDERSEPTVDLAIFPETPSSYFWSSSPSVSAHQHAWLVRFDDGGAGFYHKVNTPYSVRCVRNEP